MTLRVRAIRVVAMLALLSGCASPETSGEASAWEAYTAFQQDLEGRAGQVAWDQYLNQQWITYLDEAATAEERKELQEFASYPVWLVDIESRYENWRNGDLCFSANGTAADETPGTVSVQFVREDGKLKAAQIHYQYWQETDEFPQEALCPDQFGLDFPA